MKNQNYQPIGGTTTALDSAEDYHNQALEALDSLLCGPLGGGLGATELQSHFPLIRAALRQIRSDLERAWSGGFNDA